MSKNLKKPVWWLITIIEAIVFMVIVNLFASLVEAQTLRCVWGILWACTATGVSDQFFESAKQNFVEDYY